MSGLGISAPVQDTEGAIYIELDYPVVITERRQSEVVKALDGSEAIPDMGMMPRQIAPTFEVDQALYEQLREMQQTYSQVMVAFHLGGWWGSIQSVSLLTDGRARLNILLKEWDE